MNFKKHLDLEGQHALLSPSKYHWINYDNDKISNYYKKCRAIQEGTELHALACECIKHGITLPKTKRTLNMYVNDAIGYRMKPEQSLYYSENCFGTADSISFRKNLVRIHDYKSGETKASIKQLEIYLALFCLEYDINPNDIDNELRIYQFDDILKHKASPEDILYIMDKIISFDKLINELKAEEE